MSVGLRESIGASVEKLSTTEPGEAAEPAEVVEAPAAEVVEPVAAAEVVEAAEPTGDKPRAPDGKFAKTVKPTKAKPGAVAPDPAKAAKPPEAEATEEAPAEPPKPKGEPTKAPQSWKAAAREKWAALPPEAQAEVLRREKETATALQQAAETRKFADEFARTVAPYEGLMRANNSTPLKSVANLMQTAAALAMGQPAQKLQVVESIIDGYGVPVDAALLARLTKKHGVSIEALDAALSGDAPAQGQPQRQPAPQDFRDPRVDELLGTIDQAKRQRQQSMAQEAARENAEFGQSHEFFEDVRDVMADMLEVAARRGVALSREDAYARAVAMDPELSGVLRQREAAKTAETAQAATQRARAAASSVRTQPAGVHQAPQPTDRRGAIEASIAALSRGR